MAWWSESRVESQKPGKAKTGLHLRIHVSRHSRFTSAYQEQDSKTQRCFGGPTVTNSYIHISSHQEQESKTKRCFGGLTINKSYLYYQSHLLNPLTRRNHNANSTSLRPRHRDSTTSECQVSTKLHATNLSAIVSVTSHTTLIHDDRLHLSLYTQHKQHQDAKLPLYKY